MKLFSPLHIERELLRDRTGRWLMAVALVLVAVLWVVGIYLQPHGKLFVPLHYTIYFGIDLTGRTWQWYLRPMFATVIFLVHTLIGLSQKQALWWRLWSLLSICFTLLLAAGLVTLIFATRT